MKIFISQPMKGKSMIEIVEERKRIEKMFEGNEFIDSVIKNVPEMEGNTRVWCLGESIKKMADADLVVAPYNAYNYADCEIETIETMVANSYNIPLCKILMYPHTEDNVVCDAVCER